MITATKRLLQEIDALAARRKEEILNSKDALKIEGTTYYVSNDGDDANDGLSPEKAWKTLERVSDARLAKVTEFFSVAVTFSADECLHKRA